MVDRATGVLALWDGWDFRRHRQLRRVCAHASGQDRQPVDRLGALCLGAAAEDVDEVLFRAHRA
jgi:hypothetical protein